MYRQRHSALTPSFVPFRPRESGWVAYHAVGGPPGLAMTWRDPVQGLRWAAAINRVADGWVTGVGKLKEGWSLNEALDDMLRGKRIPRLVNERRTLALLFPHAESHPSASGFDGLPPLAEHADLARRAVAEADIPPAMRAAFLACLEHGAPEDMPLSGLRSKTQSGEWAALALAARHPELARAVLVADKMLLAGPDPTATLRLRWPGMTEAHLRRMGEGDAPKDVAFLSRSPHTAGDCLNLLFSTPVDWWPTTEEWRPFQTVATTLRGISVACGPEVTPAILSVASKGDWSAFADRLYRAAGIEGVPGNAGLLAKAGLDCKDPITSLFQDLMVPLLTSQEDEDGVMRAEYAYGEDNARAKWGETNPTLVAAHAAARELLYADKTAPGILEASQIWHARQAVMQAEIRGRNGDTEWPPLFEGAFAGDGNLSVVAIQDYATLREEGAYGPDRNGIPGLDHCVASRLPNCLTGQAHILSVREHAPDGTWRRLSTCEVSVEGHEEGRPRIAVVEHRGLDNSEPSPEAQDIVGRLSRALLSGELRAEPLALARRGDVNGGSITRKCGYDWHDPEELSRALLVWEPLLPRWARGLGPEGLYEALVEREIVPEPETASRPSMG